MHIGHVRYARVLCRELESIVSLTQTSHRLAWALMNNHLSTWCIPLNSTSYLFTQDQMKTEFEPLDLISFKPNAIASDLQQVRVSITLTLIFSLNKAILSMWLDSKQQMWVDFKCIKSLQQFIQYLILYFNMTIMVWLVPRLNASISFFTLARFLGRQAVACPSPLLSTSKPFLATFTIISHQVTPYVESSIKLNCNCLSM